MEISRYWKTIVDTLQDGVLVIAPNGTIVAANPAAARITGYSAAELVGHSCRILNCTGCKIIGKGSGTRWCPLFSRGENRDKKCLISHKNRRSVNIIKNATVLRDEEGRVIGAVETLTDISESVRQQEEIESLRKTFLVDDDFHGILGKSPVIQRLFDLIGSVARSDTPVMILGESGTGKELVARAIHHSGPRREKPYIKVNCAALNENLLESELFGHVRGAYTGADRARVGRFEAAHGGTIFLDEIGDIPPATQVKLLRVLEERQIERVGDHAPVPVDVRIITATNRNLEALIAEGRFREDLYFRINVFPLHCPTLAQRLEDIPLIVQHFIRTSAEKTGKRIEGVAPEALEALSAYPWPGNVRELRNAIEYAFVLCPGGLISPAHLPQKIAAPAGPRSKGAGGLAGAALEREQLLAVLRETSGNQSETARRLGVSRMTIWKRIQKFGIDLSAELRQVS